MTLARKLPIMDHYHREIGSYFMGSVMRRAVRAYVFFSVCAIWSNTVQASDNCGKEAYQEAFHYCMSTNGHCKEKARQGDYAAQHRLAALEYFGAKEQGIKQNIKSAMKKMATLADQGYTDSSFFLYQRYSLGQKTRTDLFTGKDTQEAICPLNPNRDDKKSERYFFKTLDPAAQPWHKRIELLLINKLNSDPSLANNPSLAPIIDQALAQPEQYPDFLSSYFLAQYRITGDAPYLLKTAEIELAIGDAHKRDFIRKRGSLGGINSSPSSYIDIYPAGTLGDFYDQAFLIDYLKKKSDQGSATAAVVLTDFYEERDKDKAAYYKEESATHGYIGAQLALASLSTAKGLGFAEKAAESESLWKVLVGVGYAVSWQGAPHDPDKGVRYLKSAVNGVTGGQGQAYTEMDTVQAMKAARRLGLFLGCQGRFEGKLGTHCSIEDAYAYSKLSDQSHILQRYENAMNSQQKAEAEKRYEALQTRFDEDIHQARIDNIKHANTVEAQRRQALLDYSKNIDLRSQSLMNQ
jgi:hypothetical protein